MAVDFKDYYKTLGISKEADQKAIRQAYRKLARKYHPDVNPGDKKAEEQFKEVNEANEVLSDLEKRKKYDEMLNYHQRTGHWPGSTGTEAGGSPYGDFRGGNYQYRTVTEEDLEDLFGGQQSPFSDFFETFFRSNFGQQRPTGRSRTRGRPGATLGEDIESPVEITLAEAYQGATRMLEVSEPNGSKRRLEVKIPAGVDEGARIRMAGQGVQGTAGRGNLYLRVHIKPDHRFSRDGTTLRITIEVPLAQAVLGGETRVPTPDGRNLMLHIPEETANGKAFRLRGQGMPHVGKPDQRGDLYAKVSVVLPTHLNEEQRRLFEAFAQSTGYTG